MYLGHHKLCHLPLCCVVLCLVLHLGGRCLVLHLGHHKLCHLANSCRTLELILHITMFVCLFTQIYVLYCQVALSLPSNKQMLVML